MKLNKHLYPHVDHAVTSRGLNLKLSISILLTSLFLSLLSVGCGRIVNTFVTKGEYKEPALPKAGLATIQVNTGGGWLQRLDRLALWIDGRLALEEKIDADEEITIKEIVVSPGQHNMSVLIIYKSFDDVTLRPHQIVTNFSADVKALAVVTSYRVNFPPVLMGSCPLKAGLLMLRLVKMFPKTIS